MAIRLNRYQIGPKIDIASKLNIGWMRIELFKFGLMYLDDSCMNVYLSLRILHNLYSAYMRFMHLHVYTCIHIHIHIPIHTYTYIHMTHMGPGAGAAAPSPLSNT